MIDPGIGLATLSALLASAKDIASKKLSFDVEGAVSACASFAYAIPYYLVVLLVLWLAGLEDFNFSVQFISLVVLRSLTDAFAEYFKMKALSSGDISVVSSFISISPLFLLITSPLITGDQLPAQGTLAILLIVSGSLILGKGFSGESPLKNQKEAVLLSLASAFCFSLNICFDRLAVQEASPAFSGFAMTLLAGLMLAPAAFKNQCRRHSFTAHKKTFFVRGFFEVSFMICKLAALQFMQAPYVSGIQKLGTLSSIIAGKVAFGEKYFLLKLTAGILILSGVTLILLAQATDP